MTRSEKNKRNELMKAYKAEGHSNREVAEHFGVHIDTAREICKGIAPQRRDHWQNEQEERIRRLVEERASSFEYAGNYTGSDGRADIRCKVCGHVMTRAWRTIRQGKVTCDRCEQNCLSFTQGQSRSLVYYKDDRITGDKVDHSITIPRVYEKDNGICYLCGERCDWTDKKYKGKYIVAGNRYPSIDHVNPVSRGGTHEWGNVRLAHRMCNMLKRDIPPMWKSG